LDTQTRHLCLKVSCKLQQMSPTCTRLSYAPLGPKTPINQNHKNSVKINNKLQCTQIQPQVFLLQYNMHVKLHISLANYRYFYLTGVTFESYLTGSYNSLPSWSLIHQLGNECACQQSRQVTRHPQVLLRAQQWVYGCGGAEQLNLSLVAEQSSWWQ
jgi:hypothetical protein